MLFKMSLSIDIFSFYNRHTSRKFKVVENNIINNRHYLSVHLLGLIRNRNKIFQTFPHRSTVRTYQKIHHNCILRNKSERRHYVSPSKKIECLISATKLNITI